MIPRGHDYFMNSPNIASQLAGHVLGSFGNDFDRRMAGWLAEFLSNRVWVAPLHLHRSDDEAWYVLEGILRVKVGNNDVELQVGSGVLVRRGTPHTYWNAGPNRVRYLLVMTSNIFQLIQDIPAPPERTSAALRAVFAKHDSELL